MKKTAEETMQVMSAFDKNQDGQLHKRDFASFIVNFAKSAGLQLIDLLDFMIVVCALKENTAAEEEYMSSILGGGVVENYFYG